MLEVTVQEDEVFLPKQNRLVSVPTCTLVLEHSLISIAKWESRWHIPYLNGEKKTREQELDYIRCMVVGTLKNENVFLVLSPENFAQIKTYMDDSMTAATFPKNTHTASKETITSESLYCRMFAHNIPMDCQNWHLNRLLALIKTCDSKKGPKPKMTKQQTAAYYAEQNAIRRAKYNTKG